MSSSADDPTIPFPPRTIEEFLAFCAGNWLSLRSSLLLEGGEADLKDNEEMWHSSERGELQVAYLAPDRRGEPGGLEITPPNTAGATTADQDLQGRRLIFSSEGHFRADGLGGGDCTGTWQIWPDGSLELTREGSEGWVRERIWFTKPNLRLRSSVEHGVDGSPGRASFSSEIRRVSRPAG